MDTKGPYIYTLYKDEKGFTEETVAALFMTGFISAAISATFMGGLADKHGRRAACLVFCGAYIVSSLTTISNNIMILFFGRVLGGIGTTLIYSVFESWMVTEYYKQNLNQSSLSLNGMFGVMHTFNSVVAITCGVVGEFLVKQTGTKTSPFVLSALSLGPAAYLMIKYWNENYGDSGNAPPEAQTTEKSGFRIVWENKTILVLGLISAAFEGTMYLFVYFWSAALKSSHAIALASASIRSVQGNAQSKIDELAAQTLPFGIIFSTFMAAMMAGSITFVLVTSGKGFFNMSPAYLLTLSITGASTSLILTVIFRDERVTFWSFALYEACIGIYFPSMAFAKSKIVEDGVRAKIYGILRIPLNLFVVATLSMTSEGEMEPYFDSEIAHTNSLQATGTETTCLYSVVVFFSSLQ
jgi:MFS family permease